MRLPFATVAREALRWGTSQREAAALVVATLIDVGLTTRDNPTMIVDQCKIRREVEKVRRKAAEGHATGGVFRRQRNRNTDCRRRGHF